MKKVTALFLVLAMLMCNLLVVSAAAPEETAVVDVAYVGENGLVELTVSTKTAAVAGNITISYDNRTLTLQETNLATDYSSVKTNASSVSCSYVNRPGKAGALGVFSFSYDSENPETTVVSVTVTAIDAEENADKATKTVTLKLAAKEDLCASNTYEDLDTNAWYHDATDYVIENGIMVGTTDTLFDPNGTTTRAMFVTILGRTAGVDTEQYGKTKVFTDVPAGKWYSAYVNWAYENEIVYGIGNGRFCPDNPITRQEMVAILARFAAAMGQDTTVQNPDILNTFADADKVSSYAAEAFAWAVENDIIHGTGTGLDPAGLATRAQTAQIIYKYQTSLD